MNYRPEIDGLRAIAVVPVILFHAGFSAFSGGFVGVDVFFVISGYLITNIIYTEISEGRFSIARFYERRARRILPALLFICVVCIPFAFLWMTPLQLEDFSQSLIAVNLFVSNILFWRETGYFEAATELKPLLHTWSLAIEEQFYIFFPPLLLLLGKMSRRSIITFVGVVSLASLAIAEWGSLYHPTANFYLLPSRTWELGVGALLALTLGNNRIDNIVIRQIGSLIGMAMIGVAIFVIDDGTRFPSLWALIPVIGTALLIACSGGGEIVGRALSWKPVLGIGLISYSAYLWHQPLFAFARIRSLNEPSFTFYLSLIAVTFLLAYITWRFVEAPFRDRRATSVAAVAKWLAPVATVLLIVGIAGHQTNGFHSLQADKKHLEDRLIVNQGLSKTCDDKFTLSPVCRTSDQPDTVVWGDSYAMHLVDGLLASDPGIKLIQHTKSVCGPIIGLAPIWRAHTRPRAEECIEFNKLVLSYIENNQNIKYAVLSSAFFQYLEQESLLLHDGKIINPSVDFVANELKKTVLILEEKNIKVTVVSPPPKNGNDIGACLLKASYYGDNANLCDIKYREYKLEEKIIINLFQRLKSIGVSVFELSSIICNTEYCSATENDIFIYRDAGHFSKEGSAYLGRKHSFRRLLFGSD